MHPASIKNTVETSLAGQSRVSKGAMLLLVALHLITKIEWCYSMLAVNPGIIGPPQMHIWTLATGGFVETNILLLVGDLVALAFAGGMFEPLWGTLEYAKFIVLVNVFTCLGTALTYITLYALRQNLEFLFFPSGGFCGFWGVLAGYLVAFKQAYPQRRFTVGGLGLALDCRLGPLLFISMLGAMYGIDIMNGSSPLMAAHGALASWIYLRYYQEKDGQRGDPSEAFTFADFFPAYLQPGVVILSNRVFKLAVFIRLCPKKPLQYDLSAPSSIKITLPGASKSDAERRRQIALRDLESRTQEKQSKGSISSMSIQESETGDNATGSGANEQGNNTSGGNNIELNEVVVKESSGENKE
eukprot:m.13642 g.13642  ORF g.13642 m.13642 type:complete len:357 (+) comp4890_c0_seq1:289-1359(+)